MTWWNEEQRPPTPTVPGTRARQRWEQLRRDAREVVGAAQVGQRLAVRWAMSGWQVWRRVDATWCEQVADADDREHAVALASGVVVDRLPDHD